MTRKGKKSSRSGGGGRRLKRSRRGTVTHSAIATIFGVGIALAPFTSQAAGQAQGTNALYFFQNGNMSAGFYALSTNLQTNWATYLFALVPVIIIALIAKKFSSKLRLSRHWTV